LCSVAIYIVAFVSQKIIDVMVRQTDAACEQGSRINTDALSSK
jgi:hypothetical protein